MKTFQSFQKNAAYLGVDANQVQKSHLFNIKNVFGLSVLGFATTSNIYFLCTTTESLNKNMFSLYMASMSLGTFLTYAVVVWKMKSLFKFVSDLEKALDSRSCYPTTEQLYTSTHELNEKLSELIYFSIVKVSSPYLVLPTFLHSFYIYFNTNFSNDAFVLPIPTWLPFDWRNPLGYLAALVIQYVVGLYNFSIIAILLSLGIGAFLFAVRATNDLTGNMKLINEYFKVGKSAKRYLKKDRKKVLKYLSDFVQFHGDIKDLLRTFLDAYQPIFMMIFIWCMISICGSLLVFQMQISHHEYGHLLETAFEACYAFGLAFIPCELGERMTGEFGQISETIERFQWYKFPIEIQKSLPIIINEAHEPVVLNCFGSTACLRASFKVIINSGFSYFMMLRQFLK